MYRIRVEAFSSGYLSYSAQVFVDDLLLALVPEGSGSDGQTDGVAVVVVLLLGLSLQEVQSPLDLSGDWWRCGDGVTLGVEAVLVGDVRDLDDLAVVSRVLVRALGDLSLSLGVAGVLQVPALLHCDAVSGLVAEQGENKNII